MSKFWYEKGSKGTANSITPSQCLLSILTFPPTDQNAGRLTVYSKLSLVLNECVNVCNNGALWWTDHSSRMHPYFFFPLTIFLKDGNHMIIWKSLIWNWSALLWAPPLCHGSTHTIMVIQFSISTWHSTACLAVEIQTKPINLLRLATLFNGKHYLKKGSIQHPP